MYSQISILAGFILFHFMSQVDCAFFSINLIHRDSPLSPLYNQSLSQSELLIKDVQRSHAQVYKRDSSSSYTNEKLMKSTITGDGYTYVTNYELGSEMFEVSAFVSLKTDFIWTKCPGMNQDAEAFVRSDSATYVPIAADDDICLGIDFRLKDNTNEACRYEYEVNEVNSRGEVNEVYSRGEVGKDNYYFETRIVEEHLYLSYEEIYFGCSEQNTGIDSRIQGVVGFGQGTTSLVSQLGRNIENKFSYCLKDTRRKATTVLAFGDFLDSSNDGLMVSSPLQQVSSNPSAYYLHFKGVTVGDTPFRTSDLIRFDSEMSGTYLKKSIYDDIVVKLGEMMDLRSEPFEEFKVCSDNMAPIDDLNVVFHFEEASMELKFSNMFVKIEEKKKICMMVFPVDEDGDSIFGSHAQVDHLITFDNGAHRIWFTPKGFNCHWASVSNEHN